MPDLLTAFADEARSLLRSAEAALARLGAADDDRTAVDDCFRAVHTVRGLAGFLELERIAAVALAVEQVLHALRVRLIAPRPAVVVRLRQALARLTALCIGAAAGVGPEGSERDLIAALTACSRDPARAAGATCGAAACARPILPAGLVVAPGVEPPSAAGAPA